MDERTKFIGRLLSGEKMAPLCREFGITRRTGYKIWERYQQDGNTGLYNRSRAPHRHPNQTPFEVEKLIVRLKTDKPSWGAPKIREIIINKFALYPVFFQIVFGVIFCSLQLRRKSFTRVW